MCFNRPVRETHVQRMKFKRFFSELYNIRNVHNVHYGYRDSGNVTQPTQTNAKSTHQSSKSVSKWRPANSQLTTQNTSAVASFVALTR